VLHASAGSFFVLEAAGVDADEERDQRIAELEQRLSKPQGLGVTPVVAATAVVICAVMLWRQAADTQYFFSAHEPIQLGAEGDYHFDRAVTNRYVELHGTPTSHAAFGEDGAKTVVAIGVRDTPVMIWRKAVKGEEWTPGTKTPPPDQRPFTVRGRLIARDEAPDTYTDAFKVMDKENEIAAKWVLVESARPGGDFVAMLWTGGLMALGAFNLCLMLRGLAAVSAKRFR
jgi:hypothetical protein